MAYPEGYTAWKASIAHALKYYRLKSGLSVDEMAGLTGYSARHILQAESDNADKTLSLQLVFEVARVLKIEPSVLYHFEEDR